MTKIKQSSLFEVQIKREVYRFNLGVKAKIRLLNNFVGFASLIKT